MNNPRAVVLKLYPNNEQADQLARNVGCCRFIYNYMLALKMEAYRLDKETVSSYSLINLLLELKQEFPWLAKADSQALQQSIQHLDLAYKNFFRRVKQGGAPGFPKFKKKGKCRDAATFTQSIRLEDNKIRLPKIGFIPVRGNIERLKNKKIKRATIFRDADGWYISCLIELTDKEVLQDKRIPLQDSACGIDLGVVQPVTVAFESDKHETRIFGKVSKHKLEKLEKKRKRLQRKLAKKKKGSKNRVKAKTKLAKAFQKERQVRKDFAEKVSNWLASNFSTIKFEDLKLSKMTLSPKTKEDGSPRTGVAAKAGLNLELLRLGSAALVTRTEQKALERGGQVIYVDPRYTSQTCSECGVIDKRSRQSQSDFVCVECNNTLNADVNAARIILRKAA